MYRPGGHLHEYLISKNSEVKKESRDGGSDERVVMVNFIEGRKNQTV